MSAMIDVVFLLLVFFVIAANPRDIIAGLQISRPHGQEETPVAIKPRLLQITVCADGYSVNGTRTSLQRIDTHLSELASYSTNTPVTIASMPDAPHAHLVKVLDICKKSELWDLRLFSL